MSKKYTNCDFSGVTSQAYVCLFGGGLSGFTDFFIVVWVSREKDYINEQKE
jgi:hypothetical protein